MIDFPVAWIMAKTWARKNHYLVAALVCWATAIILSLSITFYLA